MTAIKRWLSLAALFGLLAIVGHHPPAQAAEISIRIRDNVFDPQSRTVQQGDTVIWTHQGAGVHTVTFAAGPSSGALTAGDTFNLTTAPASSTTSASSMRA